LESASQASGPRIGERARSRSVACIGDSLVRGQVSVDFVEILKERLGDDDFHFHKAGVNGDLAYNVLTRLDVVIAQQPDFAIILVGSNDVNATLTARMARAYRLWKRLPEIPQSGWYEANMVRMISLLKERTSAKIAVTSFLVLGEDLASLPNERMRGYSALLMQVAIQEGVTYLPVHERQEQYLREVGHAEGRPHDANSMLM
jgi:lysophospholipase L1-like esterase